MSRNIPGLTLAYTAVGEIPLPALWSSMARMMVKPPWPAPQRMPCWA